MTKREFTDKLRELMNAYCAPDNQGYENIHESMVIHRIQDDKSNEWVSVMVSTYLARKEKDAAVANS